MYMIECGLESWGFKSRVVNDIVYEKEMEF